MLNPREMFSMKDIKTSDVTLPYMTIPQGCEFSPPFIKEIIDVMQGELEVVGFMEAELQQILNFLCTM